MIMIIQKRGNEGEGPVPEDFLHPVEAFSVIPHEGHGLGLRIIAEGHGQRGPQSVLTGDIPQGLHIPFAEVGHTKWEEQTQIGFCIEGLLTDKLILQKIDLLIFHEMRRGRKGSHQAKNELYLKDQSRKMRDAFRLKSKNGMPTNNLCVYGYRKDPEDRNHWLVDDEAAAVVRRIFQLAIGCHGPVDIAWMLKEEQVCCPAYYNAVHDNCLSRANTDMTRPYDWNYVTVLNILRRPEYTGCTVNCRTYKPFLKAKRVHNAPENWQIIPNTRTLRKK